MTMGHLSERSFLTLRVYERTNSLWDGAKCQTRRRIWYSKEKLALKKFLTENRPFEK